MSRKLTVCFAAAFVIPAGGPFLIAQSSVQKQQGGPVDGVVSSHDGDSENLVGFQERYPRYQLVAGDTMDLIFEFSPEFNQTVTVQPDGFISLRGVGDVHVSSETLPQLTSTLQSAYGKILNKPSISALLKDFERPYFTANGQVGRPGKYILHGEMTVTEGVAVAGGFTEKSKHSHVVLFRRVSSQWTEAKVLDVKKMMHAGNLSEDFVLHPGDMIYVPQNTISKIARFIPTSSVNSYLAPGAF